MPFRRRAQAVQAIQVTPDQLSASGERLQTAGIQLQEAAGAFSQETGGLPSACGDADAGAACAEMGAAWTEAMQQTASMDLGLIQWRDDEDSPAGESEETGRPEPIAPACDCDRDPDQEQLVMEWLRDSLATVATAVAKALTRCPVKTTGALDAEGTANGHLPDENSHAE